MVNIEIPYVDIIVGGDPCQCRSAAKGYRSGRSADLSGYFLSIIQRTKPRWVVRENVRAPDVIDFYTALSLLGYGAIIIELNSRDFTSQSRRRQYCVGCPVEKTAGFRKILLETQTHYSDSATLLENETPDAVCLTAHGNRFAAEDNYYYEPGRGLRILVPEEREALQGFPRGFTSGISWRQRHIALGNAMTVPAVKWIIDKINEVDNGI